MKPKNHKTKKGARQKDAFSYFVSLLLIGAMVFYQFLPLSLAVAEETPPEQETVTEEKQSDESASEESQDEEQDEKENSAEEETKESEEEGEEAEQETQSIEPEGQNTELETQSTEQEALNTEIQSTEQETQSTEPVEVSIEKTNDATVQNNAEVTSDTGGNTAGASEGDEEEKCDEEVQPEDNLENDPEILTEEAQASEEEKEKCQTEEEETVGTPEETDQNIETLAVETEETVSGEPDGNKDENDGEEPGDTQEENNSEENQEPADPQNQLYGGPEIDVLTDEETVLELPEEPVAEISTGEATSIANIMNDLNANLLGDNWEDFILNIEGDLKEDINLYLKFLALVEQASQESGDSEESGAAGQKTEITNVNLAEVTNNVEVSAASGENAAQSHEGNATIETGDATAVANIVNLINRNIIGDNWLFAVINIFGSLYGDIIVPGEGLLTLPGLGCGEGCLGDFAEVSNENSADIENSVAVSAATGENSAESGHGDAEISTGQAVAAADVKTIANTNIVGQNNWFFLLVNNMGSWVGNILNWDGESDSYQTAFTYAFEGDGTADPSGNTFSAENTNVAKVINNVTVTADTGNNSAKSHEGDAKIVTGDATALAKIFNFINTNIIGNNWFFAVVNIFGSWKGDVEFAYPDLEVSISDGKDFARPGDTLVYGIKYKNTGEAGAENVRLKASFSPYLSESEKDWNIGHLGPGEEGFYQVEVKVGDSMPQETVVIESAAGIVTDTREPEGGNNAASDRTQVRYAPDSEPDSSVSNSDPSVSDSKSDSGIDSELNIQRSINTSQAGPGSLVRHEIIIKNGGDGKLHDVEVKDIVSAENGLPIGALVWDIGDMKKGEKIMITYDLSIGEGTAPGNYTYSATAKGEDSEGDTVKSKKSDILLAIGGFFGNYAYASGEITPEAAAKTNAGFVLGDEEFPLPGLPLWIWILAAASYYLMLNWSLFPKRRI